MNHPDPFDYLRGGPEPVVSADEQLEARRRLDLAIAQEGDRLRHGRVRRRLILVGTLGTVGVAAGGLWRRLGVSSTVNRMTTIIRATTQPAIPEGSFAYFKSERADLVVRPATDFGLTDRTWVAYLQPLTRELWRSPDVRFLQVTTTLGDPTLFDTSISAQVSEALVGTLHEPTTEQFLEVEDPLLSTEWPSEPSRLKQSMEAYIAQSAGDRLLSVGLFELAGHLVRESWRPPQFRAAVLEVISDLPVSARDAPRGSQTFSLTYRDPQEVRRDLTFSALGYLSAEVMTSLEEDAELRIPSGTALSSAQHATPEIRSNL
jgi:hypothetical protein